MAKQVVPVAKLAASKAPLHIIMRVQGLISKAGALIEELTKNPVAVDLGPTSHFGQATVHINECEKHAEEAQILADSILLRLKGNSKDPAIDTNANKALILAQLALSEAEVAAAYVQLSQKLQEYAKATEAATNLSLGQGNASTTSSSSDLDNQPSQTNNI